MNETKPKNEIRVETRKNFPNFQSSFLRSRKQKIVKDKNYLKD